MLTRVSKLVIQLYDYVDNNKSNKLINVTDNAGHPAGFNDGNVHTSSNEDDFEYDDFGNLIVDRNKKINEITYNHLNLPKKIIFDTGEISYLYDATGVKLKKTVTDESTSQITNTHYSEGFQYTEDHLDFFPHAEGYVNVIDYSAFHYVYTYKDHLGNIRLKYTIDPETEQTTILEENHYYPYGLTHQGYNADHKFFFAIDEIIELVEVTSIMDDKYKYKYQGQERQDELGLNWDSFKWRNYDYAIGRFMSIDPLAEKYAYQSVYQFASNQPIHANEIEGLENSFDLNMRSYTAEKLSNRGHGSLKENYKSIQQAEQRGSEIALNGALVIVATLTPIPGDEAVATSLLLKTGVAALDVAGQVTTGGEVDLVGPAMNFAPLGPVVKEAVDAVIDINIDGKISTPFGSTNDQAKTTNEVLIDFTAGIVSNKVKSQVPNQARSTTVGTTITEAVLTGAENISGQLLKDSIEDEE